MWRVILCREFGKIYPSKIKYFKYIDTLIMGGGEGNL